MPIGENQGTSELRVERCTKRIRSYLGGHLVLDTRDARMVWEVTPYPHYYVPREDVVAELADTGHVKESSRRGPGRLLTVQVGKLKANQAAITYDESPVTALQGLVRIDWNSMDAWFEEDEQVFIHPRDPYTRIDALPTSRRVTVGVGGGALGLSGDSGHPVELADSVRAVALYETGLPVRFYLPKTDVRTDLLDHSSTVSYCPYKGEAEYWHLKSGRHEIADAAWSYRHPLPESARIGAYVCFDPAKVDVRVDGVAQA